MTHRARFLQRVHQSEKNEGWDSSCHGDVCTIGKITREASKVLSEHELPFLEQLNNLSP